MIILQDTREQEPLEFSHPYIEQVKRMALPCGDYAVQYKDGYIPSVIFERKSIGDLFSTMTHGYTRFKREIEKAKEFDITLILAIEGTFSKVASGYDHSEYSGDSMIRKLMTMFVKYNLYPVFCRDRVEMASYITEYYIAIGKYKGNKYANSNN